MTAEELMGMDTIPAIVPVFDHQGHSGNPLTILVVGIHFLTLGVIHADALLAQDSFFGRTLVHLISNGVMLLDGRSG